jgi:hypothetical protein
MRLKCIACEVLARPLYHFASISPHTIDFFFFQRGLHNTPGELHKSLKEQIKKIKSPPYDAILLAYGLCGKATVDIHSIDLPIIIPKAHDCITLFLGSRQRYKDEFERQPGTYWYVQDYLERQIYSEGLLPIGSDSTGYSDQDRAYLIQKFGKENAEYLMDTLGGWQKHYQRAAVIDTGLGDLSKIENYAKEKAKEFNWSFEKLSGNLDLIRNLIFGEWDDDFLIVEKGKSIHMTYDDQVIGS